MSTCCPGGPDGSPNTSDACTPPPVPCCASGEKAAPPDCPLTYFGNWVDRCLEHCQRAKDEGRPVVGIMCEYTPREIILAAGGVPVCLCGGSAEMIPPAEADLPANLCPLIKSTYGYHVTGANPFLAMADLIVAETTCDGKKKMYELMGQTRAMHVLELPQKPHEPDAGARWLAEVRRLKDVLEERFGVAITDEKLQEAIRWMNRERSLRRDLAALMQADAPPLTGKQLLDFRCGVAGVEEDFSQYEKALSVLSGAAGPDERGQRVRVLMTGVPMAHGAQRVLEIVEDHGGLVVCLESCSGVKPILEDVDESAADPLAAIAAKYLHLPCSVMTPNDDRLDMLRELARQYRPDCVLELIWQACLTYDVEAARIRRFVEDSLHVPYLRIETDYSPSDSARIAVRVEALFETVRAAAVGPEPTQP